MSEGRKSFNLHLGFWGLAEQTLPDGPHREPYLSVLSSILIGISVVPFDRVTLKLGYDCHEASFMDNVHNDRGGIKSLWKSVDVGISYINAGALIPVGWEGYSSYEEEDVEDKPLYSNCIRSLYCELLPELATRGLLEECDGSCMFHQCVWCSDRVEFLC